MTSTLIVTTKTLRLPVFLVLLSIAAGFPASAQTTGWDNSGNGMLNGTYYFRQVIYQLDGSGTGSLNEAYSLYGTVAFTGTGGTYSMRVTLVDLGQGGQPVTGTLQGTYSIAASGQGFLSSPLFKGDYVYGMVNKDGIFVGSSTENLTGYHDLLIAAPLASPLPSASTFRGSYSMSYVDLSSGDPRYTLGALAQMNPDGAGNVGTVPLTGYVGGGGSSKITQSLSNVKYIFSGGAAVVTFPNSTSSFFSGQYYLYFSPDGNFVFGGSPFAADMFVGVRTGTGTPALGGLFYEAGIDVDASTLNAGYASIDTFYGSLSANAGTILAHERLISFFNNSAINYTFSDSYNVPIPANGAYSTPVTNYVVGASGIRIASGIGPYLSLGVALSAPPQNSSISPSGVFLNPTGVVNAGSSAPFTAGIAPGELLTLYGSNLAAGTQVASAIPFPSTLGDVQVKINDTPAPLYYVTPTQISAIVPYAVVSGVAKVQVINKDVASNIVTIQVAGTAPGVLTQSQNGLGYGDVVHQDGSLVNAKNPAKIGESVSVFLTGLGVVSPAIADGAPGPSDVLSRATNTIAASIGGVTTTVAYAGLAPQLAGLYQVNLTIPAGVTAGDNSLDIAGPDAYTTVCVIAVAAASTTATPSQASPAYRTIPRTQSPGRKRQFTIPASR